MSERRAAPFRSAPEAWLLFGLLALFVATGLSVLPLPFTRDQGVYAYGAWRWLEGDIPYRDSFDHKGPALYAVYAVGLRLAGGAAWGPNLLDLLARTVTVWLLWAVGRRLAGSAAGRQPKGPRAAPVPPGGAADTRARRPRTGGCWRRPWRRCPSSAVSTASGPTPRPRRSCCP